MLCAAGTGKIALPKINKVKLNIEEDDGDSFVLDDPPSKQEIEKRQRETAARLASVPGSFRFDKRLSIEKKEIYAKLSWFDPQATGFIGRFDADLKKVRALYRFPRGSCAITSIAASKQGDLYVAGYASDRIRGASADCREEKITRFTPKRPDFGGDRYPFLARLSPDLSRVQWIREIKTVSYAPALRMLHDGNVSMLGPGYVVYAPDGKLVQATATPSPVRLGSRKVARYSGENSQILPGSPVASIVAFAWTM